MGAGAVECAVLMHPKPWSVASDLCEPVEEEAPYATDDPLSGLSRPSSVADECEPASNDEAFWYPNIDQLGNACDKSVAYEAVSKKPMMQLLDITRRRLDMTDVRARLAVWPNKSQMQADSIQEDQELLNNQKEAEARVVCKKMKNEIDILSMKAAVAPLLDDPPVLEIAFRRTASTPMQTASAAGEFLTEMKRQTIKSDRRQPLAVSVSNRRVPRARIKFVPKPLEHAEASNSSRSLTPQSWILSDSPDPTAPSHQSMTTPGAAVAENARSMTPALFIMQRCQTWGDSGDRPKSKRRFQRRLAVQSLNVAH